jgi:predicted ATPase
MGVPTNWLRAVAPSNRFLPMPAPRIATLARPNALMPSRWIIGNFKPIERADVELAPLVVVAGANSSGKSSLFQSLLFLAQSAIDEEPVLNGQLVGLGTAKDAVRDGQSVLTLGCRVSVPAAEPARRLGSEQPDAPICVEIEMSYAKSADDLRLASVQVTADGKLVLEAAHIREADLPAQFHPSISAWNPEADVLRVTRLPNGRRPRQTFVAAGRLLPEAVLYRRSASKLLAYYRDAYRHSAFQSNAVSSRVIDFENELRRLWDALPPRWSLSTEGGIRDVRERVRGLTAAEFDDVLKLMADAAQWTLEPLSVRRTPGARRSVSARTYAGDDDLSRAVHYLSAGVGALQTLAAGVRYLGPLRDAPRLVSQLGQGTRTTPVGISGEFTADFLARGQQRSVRYRGPEGGVKLAPLAEAVSEWVEYLGVGSRVVVQDQGKLGRSLRLEVDGTERDLTAVGVGASQLLPVVALVLGAPSGSVVLLEQPELHLHPAVQSRLADFFLAARRDIRVLVETHSEYLVSRIRVRVAEGRAEPARIRVLFVQRTGGVAEVRNLQLGSLGDLNEWPVGFFDASENEAASLVEAVHAQLGSPE